jgi:chromatin remodeling complex protein RSC6
MAATKKKSESHEHNGAKQARGGLAQSVTPDDSLAAVIGRGPRTRAEITKAIWEYVRTHNLQDQGDRRQINADDKLREVFGGKDQVSMFEMTRLVNQHVR